MINLDAAQSKPYWPPTVVPPKGAPNVLLIMTDDAGYGVSGTFGGVIPTPALDRIAQMGLRYTQFHSTALCSPTRAALITGRNHHSVGFGVITEQSTGYPGYDSIIGPDNATIGEILKENGYATSWFGKNHNTPSFQYSLAGTVRPMAGRAWASTISTASWAARPTSGRRISSATHPDLPVDRQARLQPHHRHGGRRHRLPEPAQRRRARQAVLPLLRARRHPRAAPADAGVDRQVQGQVRHGLERHARPDLRQPEAARRDPAEHPADAWPDDLPKWDTLDADEKKLFARQAEVFAAYVAYTDHEIGRVIQAVEDSGKLDNTLIIYIEGDNGTSAEGSTLGTPFDLAAIQGIDVPVADQLKFYDVWGSDVTTPHMSVAWSWAFDTPFKWTKQVASHFGGTRQGMAMAWPGRIKDAGGIRTQFHHVIDIVPTILEATGIQAPLMVNGIAQKPIEGVSMAYTWDKANANAPSTRTTQYFEMFGNRAIYHDGWIAATTPPAPPWLMGTAKMPDVVDGYKWELYNIAEDYSQNNDLAAKMPDKLRELQELFLVEAAKYNVFPLDNSILQRLVTPRPSATAGRNVFTYSGEMSGLPSSAAPDILDQVLHHHRRRRGSAGRRRGHDRHARAAALAATACTFSRASRCSSTTCSRSSASAGKASRRLRPGKHTIVFDFTYDGPGVGKGGTGVLKVDGKEVASKKIPHTIPFLMTIDETFDVGIDTRTPVDDNDYQVPFRFTGKLDKLTFKLGPTQLTSEDHQVIQHALARAKTRRAAVWHAFWGARYFTRDSIAYALAPMSAIDTKRTSLVHCTCPLLTQSGHWV